MSIYSIYIYMYSLYVYTYMVYLHTVYIYTYILYIYYVFFTIVHGLRVIVFGFPKQNLQYFERRVRHPAFFPGNKLFAVHFGLCFFCLV